jgi:pimeloyl-ACP methyl ester carboxylesterase
MPSLIRTGDVALHVAEPALAAAGRPPILFLHGIFAAGWVFEHAQRWFGDHGYTSYATDLRGHGQGGAVQRIGAVPARAFVDDALAAARTVAERHAVAPIVVGHSMGGLLGQKIAEAGMASALVLLCSAPPRGIPVLGRTLVSRMIRPRYLVPLIFSRPLIPTRADADAMILNGVNAAERDGIFARLAPDSGRAGRELALGAIRVDASRVRCPVLSVVGLADRFVPPRAGRAIAARYGATLLERPGRAHFLLGEPERDDLLQLIERWLATTVPRA